MALRGTLTHRKTRRLARLLGIAPCFALGVVEALFHLTAEQAPDGNIGALSSEDVAEELFYDGDPEALRSALIEAGWLDVLPEGVIYVHDWHEHCDDATDNKITRAGKTYANGAKPRMKRLSERERALYEQKASTPCESVRTDHHAVNTSCAPPEPSPEPEPSPVIPPEVPLGNSVGKPAPADKPPKPSFKPPAAQEVADFCKAQGISLDLGRQWFDAKTANGWKVGKNPMRDWRAALRYWNSQAEPRGQPHSNGKPNSSTPVTDDSDLINR